MVVIRSSTVMLYFGNGLAFFSSISLLGAVPIARRTATSSFWGRFKTNPTAWTDVDLFFRNNVKFECDPHALGWVSIQDEL